MNKKVVSFFRQFKSAEDRAKYIITQNIAIYEAVQGKSIKKQKKSYLYLIKQALDANVLDEPNFSYKEIKKEEDINVLRQIAKEVVKMMKDDLEKI